MARNRRAEPAGRRNPNPALRKYTQRWKNVGPRAAHGLEPGEVGDLCLTEGESQALVEAGYLTPAEGNDDEHAAPAPSVEDNGPPAEEKEEV